MSGLPLVENKILSKKMPWAKRLFLRQLSNVTHGHLLLVDDDGHFTFGDASRNEVSAIIQVNNPALYKEILSKGIIAAGEAYMRGEWQSPNLVAVIRFMVLNMQTLQHINRRSSLLNKSALKILSFAYKNSIARSKKNIAEHYDLGNDFFKLFLDETMMYSSGIFRSAKNNHAFDANKSMYDASIAKLDRICQQLELSDSDHLLEIGTGWGGMAIYAATHYGCLVTTTTISQEQYNYTVEKVKQLGLENKITVLLNDYRALEGQYDKLVSIEMIEAVGHQYYKAYFSQCSSLLKEDGLMLLQAITISDQRFEQAKNSVDFIQRYIFPGGCLPSIQSIADHVAKDTNLVMVDLFDFGKDYALTLKKWREAFSSKLDKVKGQGFDEQFIRMWEYYLSYCEGGFLERSISVSQLTLAKPHYRLSGGY